MLAAVFLIVLLAEWGSHSMIDAHPASPDASSISAHDDNHGDLCDTLILCSDSGRRDGQRSEIGRDLTQHSAPLDLLSDLSRRTSLRDGSRFEFSTASGLFRPISPPFHPPELS